MFRRAGRIRPLRMGGGDAAIDFALRDPVANALAGARLADIARMSAVSNEFSVAGDEARPAGLLWHGVNLSPLSATEEALVEFGRFAAPRARRASSVVGVREDIEIMWRELAPVWGRDVREYRWSQPLLVAGDQLPEIAPPGLRRARLGEDDLVFPAAVAMFREEVGVDPTRGDGGRSYRARVRELIRLGRTYIVVQDGAAVFKADVGARFGPVSQIHGVWVDPGQRGRGLGRSAMVELARQVRRDHSPTVSLYVNDYNEPARRAYAAAGFHQVGELATILF